MKILNGNKKEINDINHFITEYIKYFNIPEGEIPEFEIFITDNFVEDNYYLSSQYERDQFNLKEREPLNGRVIFPNEQRSNFTILIQKKLFSSDLFINTLFHEITHLLDYSKYFYHFGNPLIMNPNEKEKKYFWEFYYWSEFHAKRNGLFLYILLKWKKTNEMDLPRNGRIDGINIDFQTKNLINKILSLNNLKNSYSLKTNDFFWKVFESYISYLGRMSLFQEGSMEEFPDKNFPKDLLIKSFGETSIEIYQLFLKINHYKEAIKYRKDIRRILESIKYYYNKKIRI